MANFQTHFNVGAFVSAVGTGAMYYSGLIHSKEDATLLFIGGTIGGILPDIDSPHSTPLKISKYLIANLVAFFILFKYINVYPIYYVALMWLASFIGIMLLFHIFTKITSHRGMFHSIPAGVIFWFIFTLFFYYVLKYNYLISWYFGMFIFLGYMTHLTLDEIYSVDVRGMRLKKSFGTALKFWSKDAKSVLLFYAVIIGLFMIMPHKKEFYHSFSKVNLNKTYHKLLKDENGVVKNNHNGVKNDLYQLFN